MKSKKLLITVLIVSSIFLCKDTFGVATGIGYMFPSIMRGVRPLGMGNAFVAMPGTDSIAPFYNPAAINDFEEKRQYSVGVPMVDFNPNFFDAAFDLLDLKHNLKKPISSSQKIDYFNAYTKKYMGQFNTLMTSMPLFQVRHKYYALSAVGDYRLTLSFRNITFPNFDFKTLATTGIVGGSAYNLFGDYVQIGANLKILYRMTREDEVTSADVVVNSIEKIIGWQTWRKGMGVGADAGVKIKFPLFEKTLKPTLGIVVQDIGNTLFSGEVLDIPMSISAGMGVFPKIGPVELAFLMDIREINQKKTFLNKFHFGTEARLPEIKKIKTRFTLRAGCNQGYISTGFTAKWPLVSFLFAFYGEEVGKYSHSKASYRLSNQVSFDF